MKKFLFMVLFFGLVTFAAPCPVPIASCAIHEEDAMSCLDFTDPAIPMGSYEAACRGPGTVFSAAPCTGTNLVGSCAQSYGNINSVVMRFYAPFPPEYVEMVCAQSGGNVCQ